MILTSYTLKYFRGIPYTLYPMYLLPRGLGVNPSEEHCSPSCGTGLRRRRPLAYTKINKLEQSTLTLLFKRRRNPQMYSQNTYGCPEYHLFVVVVKLFTERSTALIPRLRDDPTTHGRYVVVRGPRGN